MDGPYRIGAMDGAPKAATPEAEAATAAGRDAKRPGRRPSRPEAGGRSQTPCAIGPPQGGVSERSERIKDDNGSPMKPDSRLTSATWPLWKNLNNARQNARKFGMGARFECVSGVFPV